MLAAFLGGQALADTKRVRGTSPVPDRSIQPFEALGFVSFLAVLFFCALILVPKFKHRPKRKCWQIWRTETKRPWQLWRRAANEESWKFRLNAQKMLTEINCLRQSRPALSEYELAQVYKQQLVEDREKHHAHNEPKLEARFYWLLWAIFALGLEAIGFGLDLVT